jgi:hypothetical protein
MTAIIFSTVLLIISLLILWYVWKRQDWSRDRKVLITILVILALIVLVPAAFIKQYVKLPDELIEEIMK